MIIRKQGFVACTVNRALRPLLYYKRTHFKAGLRRNTNCSQYFITTPIFYVNAQPHIGHLHSALLADAGHRFRRLQGKNVSSIFSTGTDEHGLKIQQAAASAGVPPLEFCNEVSKKFKCLFDAADINYTDYIRTVEDRHIHAAQHFFRTLTERGHIYSGSYSGWYCISDEAFLTDKDVQEITGNTGKKQMVSIESGHPVEWNTEENYMFKLSNFQDELKYWLKDDSRVQPKRFLEELRKLLCDDLKDLSASRPRNRVSWGVPVPGDDRNVMYVWIDALVNYLTVSGYPDLTMWPPDVQIIGKDILRFHGIFWPALLIAAGLEPPRKLLCHSHWLVDGMKMSKSLGNVVCPHDRLNRYTSDGLRYLLLREGTPHSDNTWNDTRLVRMLNAELADSLGNLLNRCTAPSLNPSQKFPVLNVQYLQNISLSGQKVMELLAILPSKVEGHYNNFDFYRGINAIIAAVHSANCFVQEEKPWELKKLSDRTALDSVLRIALETVRVAGIALQPIVPVLASSLLDSLGISPLHRSWDDMKKGFLIDENSYWNSTHDLGPRIKLFTKVKEE